MLKSVEEHNAQKRKEREDRNEQARRTGVACPACGAELVWFGRGQSKWIFCEYPVRDDRPSHCEICGVSIRLEV